ncbi:MAG TPA: hypothetical protein VHO03_12070 [Ignavibacteriales bacterium]|nr:hypothetical protein [Ignavibacteriales bacterium]
MKPFGLSILISLLFLTSFLSAQTFQAGLKLDSEHMSTGPGNLSPSSPLLSSVYITAAVFTRNDLAFEARLGYNWEDHYNGIQAGVFSKYYYKDLYAIGGIFYHHINKVTPDDIYRNYYSQEADLFLPALGLGFNPGRHFAFEVMFQHGLNQKIGYYYNPPVLFNDHYRPVSEIFPDVNLKWIFNIGVSYNFSF